MESDQNSFIFICFSLFDVGTIFHSNCFLRISRGNKMQLFGKFDYDNEHGAYHEQRGNHVFFGFHL